jgi:heterodisulfide reductase subunit D
MSIKVPVYSTLHNEGISPEILFWVGCAGSFDARAQRITKAFCTILNKIGVSFAILGDEENCTGDPARRAGNEFLFQMLALQNIQTLNKYKVKKIVTACPHCFNTLKNEYLDLGGNYEVIHHTSFLNDLIKDGKLVLQGGGSFIGKKITYHDSCYLGRINGVFEAPREILEALDADLVELKRCKSNGLCCGAGGAQMWKEDEPGSGRINHARADEIKSSGAEIVAANCPFCITMLQDGLQTADENNIMVLDLSELIVQQLN